MAIAFRMKKKDHVTCEVVKFHKACMEGRLSDIKMTLEKGIDIEARSGEYGITALSWSSMYGKADSVEFLLCRGANVNATNNYGRTALVYATIHGHLNVVAVLLAHGALVYTTNRNGKTAFDWAKSTEVKDLLRKAMIYERRRSFMLFLAYLQFLLPQPKFKPALPWSEKGGKTAADKAGAGWPPSHTRAEKVLGMRDLHRQIMAFL